MIDPTNQIKRPPKGVLNIITNYYLRNCYMKNLCQAVINMITVCYKGSTKLYLYLSQIKTFKMHQVNNVTLCIHFASFIKKQTVSKSIWHSSTMPLKYS